MNLGIIGNCKSAALIDDKGTIKWCCLPDFDSASVFAKILDEEKGGEFAIVVDESYTISQKYIPCTNILKTTFTSPNGAFQLIDFMPRYKNENSAYICPPEIIRYIKYLYGEPVFSVFYNPKLNYAKYKTETESDSKFIKSFVKQGEYESLYLYTNIEHDKILQTEKVRLHEDAFFVLSYHQKLLPMTVEKIILEYERTKVYWLDWIQRSIEFKAYVHEVRRSALVLKLLSYQDSGAILAAPTTSLPETIGEERNWDYRFCWIRDASMILSVLTKIGHFNVAKNFINYILNVVPYKKDKVQIMYGIRGEKELTEKTLDWLSGYKNSKPVRIGNAAFIQKQNDIYGVLLDAIYKYIEVFKSDIATVERLWTITRRLVRTVCENWHEEDMGIWEFRKNTSHFVFSKVLCWVALDRGIKIAKALNCGTLCNQWPEERDKIKNDILENGWNEEIGAFTQSYGSDSVDASNLLMADYGFISPKDEKYISTVKITKERLSKNGLMFRYKNKDDFGIPTSSFTVCTFWLIKALWKIGEKKESREMFDNILKYRNHLGLLSEDLDFETKELLGNFPQGYSHLALIDCALSISEGDKNKESELVDYIQNIERREE